MVTRPLGAVTVVGLVALAVLPFTVDSPVTALGLVLVAAVGLIRGWFTQSRLTVGLITTTAGIVDWFELVRLFPAYHWLILTALAGWIAWLTPDALAVRRFHPVLAGFLTTELFLVLLLWPVNVLSKATVLIAFVLLLWQELSRSVVWSRRFQESVLPFIVVTILMTLTGHWLTF